MNKLKTFRKTKELKEQGVRVSKNLRSAKSPNLNITNWDCLMNKHFFDI